MSLKTEQEKSRKATLKLLKKMRAVIQKQYTSAVDAVAAEVAYLQTKGQGVKYSLTIASKEILIESLKEESKKLRIALNKSITSGTNLGIASSAGQYGKYANSFLAEYTDLDKKILNETFAKVNSDLAQIQLLKTYSDDLTYSRRIWKSTKLFERDVRNVVAEGMLRNRSTLDISKDLKVYVRKGKEALVKRYANLDTSPIRPGETEAEYLQRVKDFTTRISSNIEYNSLRIARTQIQGAVQDSNISCQSYVPSAESFDWTLSPAHKVYSICEDIEAGNPWTYETFSYPTPPHINCLSYTVFKEIPNRKFVSDLKKWSKNPTAPGTDYLNDWKTSYYDKVERGELGTNFFSKLLKTANSQSNLKRRVA